MVDHNLNCKITSRCEYLIHISAYELLKPLFEADRNNHRHAMLALGWGAWENEAEGLIVGTYHSTNGPNLPPAYKFDEIVISFPFPNKTSKLPRNGIIIFENGHFNFSNEEDFDSSELVEGFLIG